MSQEGRPKPQKLQRVEVVIKKIDISFEDMIGLMVKVGIASIPALIILGVVYFIFIAIFAGVVGS